jgi:hypothetical protein
MTLKAATLFQIAKKLVHNSRRAPRKWVRSKIPTTNDRIYRKVKFAIKGRIYGTHVIGSRILRFRAFVTQRLVGII